MELKQAKMEALRHQELQKRTFEEAKAREEKRK